MSVRPMMAGRRTICVVAVLLASCGAVRGGDGVSWDAWERMPVLHHGRIKPVDTFARVTVQAICGRESPTLLIDGTPKKFNPSELVFSWLVEPERWERVAFLAAGNEELRKDLLGLKLLDEDGNRLKYASPRDVLSARKFHERRQRIGEAQDKAEKEGKNLELGGLDKKVAELWMEYVNFRQISFSPDAPRERRNRFIRQLNEVSETWEKLAPALRSLSSPEAQGISEAAEATNKAIEALFKVAGQEESGSAVRIGQLDPLVVALRRAAEQLQKRVDEGVQRVLANPPQMAKEQLDAMRIDLRGLAIRAAELAALGKEAHYALYDNGDTMTLIPALNPAALEKNRLSGEDAMRSRTTHAQIIAPPWLSLHAVMLGSKELLNDYPQAELGEVRQAFAAAKAAYLDQKNPQRAEECSAALGRFVAAARALGEAIEPLREQLPLKERDEGLMAATAYPPPQATDMEVRYNRMDPFTWTWILSLLGVCLFALGFGSLRRPTYWLGLAAVLGGQVFAVAGLGMRVLVTGLAPVTNMFETVIYVASVVAILGLWFALLPLLGRGLSAAWRMTSLPFRPEAGPLEEELLALASPGAWRAIQWAMVLPRVLLVYAVFTALVMGPQYIAQPGAVGAHVATTVAHWSQPAGATYGYFPLVPRSSAGAGTTINDVTTWAVGLCVLALGMYYLPRLALMSGLAIVTIPYAWIRQGLAKPLEQVVARKPFVVAGAATAFAAAFLACYVPTVDRNVLNPQINPLMPVLRDNFWLTSHVLTITASYGAGALAWGLANIALAYYLFGKYRNPSEMPVPVIAGQSHRPAADAAPAGAAHAWYRRPPDPCAALGSFTYKANQVAVLLLLAGTILGALWADVAWGRFWGWDAKEVWALISTLVYLAVLHGRYAGWFGNFGLAVGSVIGATAIVMAWYGVNFIFKTGLHAYATGAGGQWWVVAVVLLNWIYAGMAAVRYHIETRTPPAA